MRFDKFITKIKRVQFLPPGVYEIFYTIWNSSDKMIHANNFDLQ